MLSSVFCSRISCGWICIWKRRATSNRCSSTSAEGNVLERLVEDRLADRAHRGFELVHARAGGHPAALEVQHRDPAVVALEEGEEIPGEIELVARVERADDAEIDGRVARIRRVADVHEDVAGMHVGVEEVVAEHLGEEDLSRRSRRACGMSVPSSRSRATSEIWHAVNALHHHDVAPAEVPVHLRHVQHRANRRSCA